MNRPSPTALNSTGVVGTPGAHSGADLSQQERLSALADGELDLVGEAALWRDDTESLTDTWSRYQLIGEALRGTRAQALDAARVAAIMLQVRQERAVGADVAPPKPTQLAPAPDQVMVAVPHDAANDSVFRWKMLAGFASLAAVVAVAWNMNTTLDVGGPQLAQGPAAPVVSVTAPVPASESASVDTRAGEAAQSASVLAEAPQGPVLRDARLEELMAAHRQAGGMSALQMPAGFLRNAAFDLPEGQR